MLPREPRRREFFSLVATLLPRKTRGDLLQTQNLLQLAIAICDEKRGYKTVKHVKYDIGNGKCMIYEIMRKGNDSKRYQR